MALRISARRPRTGRWLVTAASVIALVAALSACATNTAVPASQAVPAGDGPLISGPLSTTDPPPTGIATAITPVGTVLTSDGFTLYRYAKDAAAPPRSRCTGGCATTWPPVLVTPPLGGNGMDPALLGTLTRPDGKQQLTVGGWPVYRFVRDTARGDAKGQDSGGGAWRAIGFDGKPIT